MSLSDDLRRSDLYERAIDALFPHERPTAYWMEQKLKSVGLEIRAIEEPKPNPFALGHD